MIILRKRYSLVPGQQYFSAAGFTVAEQDGKGYVDLPNGWNLAYGRKLVDERGRIRGYYDEDTDYLALSTYYRVVMPHQASPKCQNAHYWVVVDYLDRVVYMPQTIKILNMSMAEIFLLQCRNFLETHYPQWKNPNAYW